MSASSCTCDRGVTGHRSTGSMLRPQQRLRQQVFRPVLGLVMLAAMIASGCSDWLRECSLEITLMTASRAPIPHRAIELVPHTASRASRVREPGRDAQTSYFVTTDGQGFASLTYLQEWSGRASAPAIAWSQPFSSEPLVVGRDPRVHYIIVLESGGAQVRKLGRPHRGAEGTRRVPLQHAAPLLGVRGAGPLIVPGGQMSE